MTEAIFEFLVQLDDILWNRIGLLIILSIGVYLTIYSKFFQFRALFKLKTYIKDLIIYYLFNNLMDKEYKNIM